MQPRRRAGVRDFCPGLAVLCFCLALAPTTSVHAQDVERERRISLAPELGLVELSPALRNRLDLFPDVQGFTAARLLVRDDGTTVLELESSVEGELRRERRILTETQLAELRSTLAGQLAEAGGVEALDRSGRGGFVLGHTVIGLGYHGWVVPWTLDLESTRANVAAYLLTAGASFYVPYRLTRDGGVSGAQRDLSLYGGTRGILAGALLGDIFAGSEPDPDRDDRIRLGTGLAGSLAGSALGFLGGRGADEGSVALWGVMSDFGLAAGAATAYTAGPYAPEEITVRDGDLISTHEETRNAHVGHAMTVAGGIGGLLAGRWLGSRSAYTEGNAGALRSAGILGAQIGVSSARAFTTEGRVIAGVGLAGALSGIVAGDRLLEGRRLSNGEGLLINAAQVAGGATALGLTYLLVYDIEDHVPLYLSTSTLGSLLGAGLVYAALGSGSEEMALGPSRGTGRNGGWSVSVHPENLLFAGVRLLGSPPPLGGPPSGRAAEPRPSESVGARLPVVTLRF